MRLPEFGSQLPQCPELLCKNLACVVLRKLDDPLRDAILYFKVLAQPEAALDELPLLGIHHKNLDLATFIEKLLKSKIANPMKERRYDPQVRSGFLSCWRNLLDQL